VYNIIYICKKMYNIVCICIKLIKCNIIHIYLVYHVNLILININE